MTFRQFLVLLENFVKYPEEIKFHRDVYLPPTAARDLAKFYSRLPQEIRQSAHWRMERWWKHSYDDITKNDLSPKYAFEFAYAKGEIIKVGFRVEHLDPKDDIVYIVSSDGKVVTTWPNAKSDTHRTLNRSKYATKWPETWPKGIV